MSDIEYCPHCGASMKMYWHTITPLLITTLQKFKSGVLAKGENKIHLIKDLDGRNTLTKNEYNNFQKLRFHGLVVKYKKDHTHLGGYWLLSKRGSQFLRNEITIPKRVLTFRNKVVDHSTEHVNYRDVMKSYPLYLETNPEYELADLVV